MRRFLRVYTFRSSDILFLRMTIRTEHESIVTISLPVDDEHSSSTTFSNDYYATITIDISNVRHLDRSNDRNDNRRRVRPCEKNKPVEGVDDAYDSERFDTPETVSIVIQSTSGDPTRETGDARRYTRSPWARLDRVSRQSM